MSRAWLPRWDGLPPAYWILWAGTFVNRLGGFVVPFLSLYLTAERRVPLVEVGVYVALFGLGQLGAGPAGGWLADRIGRRRTLLLALVLGAAAMLHLGFAARARWQLGLGCFALGLCGDLYRPASHAAVADLVRPEDRLRAYALLYWVVNLAFAIAAIAAGLLAKVGYVWLFAGDAATTLAFAAIVWARLPETQPARSISTGDPGSASATADDAPSPWANPPYLAFCGLAFLVTLVFQQSFVGLPVDMRANGVPSEQYGSLIAINGILIVLLQPFVIGRIRRLPAAAALALGAALTGVGFGGNALAGTALLYGLAIAVWTLGEIVSTAVSPAVVAAFAPASMRGRYQGVFQMTWGASGLAGPIAGTFVLDRAGSTALWLGCLAVGLAAAAGNLALGDKLRT